MLAGIMAEDVLFVLAEVLAFIGWTSIRPSSRQHRIDPFLEVEFCQMVLLLPVLVLGVRHKPANLTTIAT